MAVQIQIRGDTAANWISNNPNLAARELGYETDTGKFKIGPSPGPTAWNSISSYVVGVSGFSGTSGFSGVSGASNTSGYSGASGAVGAISIGYGKVSAIMVGNILQ
jgi:hypothetical protein